MTRLAPDQSDADVVEEEEFSDIFLQKNWLSGGRVWTTNWSSPRPQLQHLWQSPNRRAMVLCNAALLHIFKLPIHKTVLCIATGISFFKWMALPAQKIISNIVCTPSRGFTLNNIPQERGNANRATEQKGKPMTITQREYSTRVMNWGIHCNYHITVSDCPALCLSVSGVCAIPCFCFFLGGGRVC